MWKMVDLKKLNATKALAIKFCEMEGVPNDRPMKEHHLRGLIKVFQSGEFRTCEWASVYCPETGLTYRVNGKHTSTILASDDQEIPEGLVVTVSHFEAETLEDVAKLYATFDPRGSARTPGDIHWSVAGCHPILKDYPRGIIRLAAIGLAYEKFEFSNADHVPIERALLLLDNVEYCAFLREVLVGDCKHIARGPVTAAMVRTFRKCQSASLEFWTLVRDETGNSPNSPDRKLAKYLNRTAVNLGGGSKGNKQVASTAEMMAKCLHAWNAWRKGLTTDLKYYPNAKMPVAY